MRSSDERQWLLKALSGPHVGAEVELAEGDYVVGRDDDCDIVLDDHTLAGRHARLSIHDGSADVEAMDGEILIDGAAANGTAHRLEIGQIVTLGTSSLGIGAPETQWDGVAPPQPKPVSDAGGAQPMQPPAPGAADEAPGPHDTPRRRLWPAAALVLAALAVAAFLWTDGRDAAPEIEGKALAAVPLQAARAVIESEGFTEVKAAEDGPGRLEISGYVATDGRKRVLVEALESIDAPTKLNVWSAAQLQAGARTTLEALGFSDLQIEYRGSGSLHVSGYAAASASMPDALNTVRQDVPGIAALEHKIETQADREAVLDGLLRERALHAPLTVDSTPGELTVTGTLNAQQMQTWRAVRAEFVELYGGAPAIADRVEALEAVPAEQGAPQGPRGPAPYLNITGVFMGGVPHVIMADGRTYLEGDQVGGGFRIERIEFDQVLLRRDDQVVSYRIGVKQ